MSNIFSFSAKKSLGQNFLHAPHIVGLMVHTALESIEKNNLDNPGGTVQTVLEIGPGKGVLTEGLLAAGKDGDRVRVVAIEKDDRAIPFLEEKFATEILEGRLVLVHGDILEFGSTDFARYGLIEHQYTVVANIPYYITGEMLRKFLEGSAAKDDAGENTDTDKIAGLQTPQPSCMVLMLQKEVAQRIVAREGGKPSKESILSISVKVFGEPTYIETVAARHFRPVPNVDSAVLKIDRISNKFFRSEDKNSSKDLDIATFFRVIKAGFAHKRKVVLGNLGSIIPRQKLEIIWSELNLDQKIRAEDISTETWKKIVERI